jgi:ABC-type nitrate/sulfonate/bicarbonate transport system permease component
MNCPLYFVENPVFAGILIIGVIGLMSDALIRFFGSLLFPWREAGHV